MGTRWYYHKYPVVVCSCSGGPSCPLMLQHLVQLGVAGASTVGVVDVRFFGLCDNSVREQDWQRQSSKCVHTLCLHTSAIPCAQHTVQRPCILPHPVYRTRTYAIGVARGTGSQNEGHRGYAPLESAVLFLFAVSPLTFSVRGMSATDGERRVVFDKTFTLPCVKNGTVC